MDFSPCSRNVSLASPIRFANRRLTADFLSIENVEVEVPGYYGNVN